jgi:hypothetical protein
LKTADEGCISVLFRVRGMKRCPDGGPGRFEKFVGACVLPNGLMIIARLFVQKDELQLNDLGRGRRVFT